MLSYLLNKPLKMKKAKINFIFNTLPSIVIFIVLAVIAKYTNKHMVHEVEKHMTTVFVTFMILTRCIRMVSRQISCSHK